MAKVNLGSVLHGLSGAIGDQVFRRYRGRTVVQRRPVFTQPWSEAQTETRHTFAGGSRYAAQVKADPALRELYATRGKRRRLNYRQMAIRDFFHAPKVDAVDTSAYQGETGGRLTVRASDDFEVVRVTIALQDPAGNIVATCETAACNSTWQGELPAVAHDPASMKIVVTAFDRPGNATTRAFPVA